MSINAGNNNINVYSKTCTKNVNDEYYEINLNFSVSNYKKKLNKYFDKINDICFHIIEIIKEEKNLASLSDDKGEEISSAFDAIKNIIYHKINKKNQFSLEIDVERIVKFGEYIRGYSEYKTIEAIFSRSACSLQIDDTQLLERSLSVCVSSDCASKGVIMGSARVSPHGKINCYGTRSPSIESVLRHHKN